MMRKRTPVQILERLHRFFDETKGDGGVPEGARPARESVELHLLTSGAITSTEYLSRRVELCVARLAPLLHGADLAYLRALCLEHSRGEFAHSGRFETLRGSLREERKIGDRKTTGTCESHVPSKDNERHTLNMPSGGFSSVEPSPRPGEPEEKPFHVSASGCKVSP
jgi:hypothetical protein